MGSSRESAHRENMLSAASAAASSAKRSEELLRKLVEKDRAAILSEWTDRDMSVGGTIYKAGSVTIADILDHAAREARLVQGEKPWPAPPLMS